MRDSRSTRELELLDRLSDLLAGFEFWYAGKLASAELTTLDEMFIRWVQHETSCDIDPS